MLSGPYAIFVFVYYGCRTDSQSLLGFVNAILFTATRRVVPAKTIVPSVIRSRAGNQTSTHHSTTGTGTLTEKCNDRSFMHASEVKAQTHRVLNIPAIRKECFPLVIVLLHL